MAEKNRYGSEKKNDMAQQAEKALQEKPDAICAECVWAGRQSRSVGNPGKENRDKGFASDVSLLSTDDLDDVASI